jgi:ATP-dependent protease ClpP protease subunit
MERVINAYYLRCDHKLLTKKQFREKIMPIESYFDAKTCVKLGLADEIIEPVVKFRRK